MPPTIIDNISTTSCLVPIGSIIGKNIETIEGFRDSERFGLIADAFAETGAVQCGFCSPGFVMTLEAFLRKNPNPTELEIREALSGNLCRCTGYNMIIDGCLRVVEKGGGLW